MECRKRVYIKAIRAQLIRDLQAAKQFVIRDPPNHVLISSSSLTKEFDGKWLFSDTLLITDAFDVYNIETALPVIDLEAIETHLMAAKEEEQKVSLFSMATLLIN